MRAPWFTISPQWGFVMGKRIIVVDDDELVLMAVSELLASDGYDVVTSARSVQALDILAGQNFDLCVFDVIMPEMDGYQLCMKVREMPKYADIPIVMLTAKSGEEDKAKGLAAGATLYLPKPIAPDKLLNLVGSIMKAS